MVIQPLKQSSGNYVRNSGLPLAIVGSRATNTPLGCRFAQNADHFATGSPFSAFFIEVVCDLGATQPRTAAALPPIGGNCTTRGVDTPATCRRSASHGAKYPIVASLKCAASPTRLRRSRLVRKTRPASTIMPNLGCIERAGRTFSRSHPHQAVQGEIVRAQDAETWRR